MTILCKTVSVETCLKQHGKGRKCWGFFCLILADATSANARKMNYYFMFSGRISRIIGENIFRSYTGTTSENTNFHVFVA